MIVDPNEVISAGLAMLPAKMDSRAARVLMYAIGLQESKFDTRRQYGDGPARGLWQFERGGGVKGVLHHTKTRDLARQVCAKLRVEPMPMPVWNALETNDTLAAVFARLLLYTDQERLPAAEDADKAFDCYVWNWRPGAYARGTPTQKHALRSKFLRNHAAALKKTNGGIER